jgi:gentisate 1,2-dioxygenase
MRAAELVGTQQAERRVLRLTNPELSSASNTLVANIQIVMPGEIVRAHRHSAAALRLIIEGGAVTPSSTVSASRCTRAISSSRPTGHGTTMPTTPMRR